MSKEKVLFIEDDEDIQELVRYNLERDEYDTKREIFRDFLFCQKYRCQRPGWRDGLFRHPIV